jgi:hypothetical protein
MATKCEKIQGLRDFFADAFTASELEIFLTLKGYGEVACAVNRHVSGLEYFFNVVQTLDRRGLIDEVFFTCLAQERPRKGAVIRSLQESWLASQQHTSVKSIAEHPAQVLDRPRGGPPRSIASRAESSALDSQEVRRATKALADCLGPIAYMIADEQTRKARDLDHFYELLGSEIPSGPQRKRFLDSRPR